VNPLSLTYGALSYARNLLFDTGFVSAHLRGPVVSVGSISAGGAGKTPFVIRLGKLLQARQIPFDVLSRGYGRKTKGVRLVQAEGGPRVFGDEPLLITRRLGVPVVVGENRYHAGLFAEQRYGPQLHLLDDGFQHRALARPDQFFSELRGLGVSATGEIAFPDHHAYDEPEIKRLLATARDKAAEGFVTTEKDLINLGPLVKALQPLTLAKVEIEFEEGEAAVSKLLEAISARSQGGS
jgi:tetraacyldisaccharide-1-P 4'-kinase